MLQLTAEEFSALRYQTGTSKVPPGRGGRRYRPYAFTEHGVAMLSAVLGSPRAVTVSIELVRAFVRLREAAVVHQDLGRRVDELERRSDARHREVFRAIRLLMTEQVKIKAKLTHRPAGPSRRRIGFGQEKG